MTSLLSNQILLSLKSYYQILLKEFIKIKSKHGPNEKKSEKFCCYEQPHEYIDDSKKSNETSLPGKEDFYNQLNMMQITDADYSHMKRACKYFKYHDLFVQSDT